MEGMAIDETNGSTVSDPEGCGAAGSEVTCATGPVYLF
ncbi:hypothetical protein BSU04_36505 [Caballeronia sordidicola]|uniref:Uncharacterized protein n=1 Tax=Caballeronia sordidicola TaxID=196367 RepID=A0A226WSW8_CABSO|nr:hypothetical protein BSU04_36505 [Caballeronia sordidicola]